MCRARFGSSGRFRRASSRIGSRRSGREPAPLPCRRGAGRRRHLRTVHRRAGRRPPPVSASVARERSPHAALRTPRRPLALPPARTQRDDVVNAQYGPAAALSADMAIAANLSRAILRASARAFPGGSKGGGSTPRQSANVLHRVGWLTDLKSVQPALGGAAENASQAAVRSSVHRAVAGKLAGLSVAGLTDGEGNGRPSHLPGDSGGSLPTAVFPLPLPLGNPRSSI